MLEELRRHADARVADDEAVDNLVPDQVHLLGRAVHGAAGLVVFDAVLHQVQEHAAHVQGASVYVGVGEGVRAAGGQRDAAAFRADLPQHEDVAAQVRQVERQVLKLNGVVLDLAHLQDVVDQREQMVGRHLGFLAVLAVRLRVVGVLPVELQKS